MAEFFTLTGVERVQNALVKLGPASLEALGAALYEEARAIITTSQEQYVPVDTGNLRDSAYFSPPVMSGGRIEVELGYGGTAAPYAAIVHENPRAGQTGGVSPTGQPYSHWAKVGEWKYLESPWKASVAGMSGRMAATLEARLRALG